MNLLLCSSFTKAPVLCQAFCWAMKPSNQGPHGILAQQSDGIGASAYSGPDLKIKISHGSSQHEISIPAQSTFRDLKRLLVEITGLHPQQQRLLFRGKEKDDEEYMYMVGVKDMSKVVLLEEPAASKVRKHEEFKMDEGLLSEACEAVAIVRSEVDLLADKVSELEISIFKGSKVDEKEFVVLTELLMKQLLKLDAIEADGEAKVQRKNEVRRVQSCVEALDTLKTKNANPFIHCSNSVSVSTKWENFESDMESLDAPSAMPSSVNTYQDWERFD